MNNVKVKITNLKMKYFKSCLQMKPVSALGCWPTGIVFAEPPLADVLLLKGANIEAITIVWTLCWSPCC